MDLEDLDEEQIPEQMRGMSLSAKRAYLLRKQKERASIMKEIEELTEKRSEYIREQMKTAEVQDSFDETVKNIIAHQAKQKGILY